jgi:hypothetical protein
MRQVTVKVTAMCELNAMGNAHRPGSGMNIRALGSLHGHVISALNL